MLLESCIWLVLHPRDFLLSFFVKVLLFYISSYISDPFWVNFYRRCETYVKIYLFIYLHVDGYPLIPAPCVEKTIFPPLNFSCTFFQKSIEYICGRSISFFFYSVPVIYVFISPPISYDLEYCSSIINLEIGWKDSSHFTFISKLF